MRAASTISTAKQTADTGVKTREMPVYQGTMMPTAPNISLTPIECISGAGKFTTPVCPLAINCRSDKMLLQKPEYANTIAKAPCAIHNIVFIKFNFTQSSGSPQAIPLTIVKKTGGYE